MASSYSALNAGSSAGTLSSEQVSFQRTPFLFIQENKEHKIDYKNLAYGALEGINMESVLSQAFFSKENTARIQSDIRKEVFKRSHRKYYLGEKRNGRWYPIDQDENELFLYMRAVFLQRGTNKPYGVKEQITELNRIVVDEAVPDILTNIKQERDYLRDIDRPLIPLPAPLNTSSAGRKTTLPSLTTVF